MEDSYVEFNNRLINEVVDVFERNGATVFDVFRVSSVLYETSKEYVRNAFTEIDGQLDELMDALAGVREILESE